MSTISQQTAPGCRAVSASHGFPAHADDGGVARRTDVELSPAACSLGKRAVDLVGAAAGLLLLSPVMLVVALVVKLDSRGPVLFGQTRMRHGCRTFRFLKFRTMAVDAESRLAELEVRNEAAGGVLFKIRDDPRVTRVGRFLRKTSLDELPQLLNVLAGHMSLVGPRPLQMRDCLRLEALDAGAYARRHSVPQGLTGAWQVGGRSNEDSVRMIELDLDYADRWSLALDLVILCKTVPAVFSGRGAC